MKKSLQTKIHQKTKKQQMVAFLETFLLGKKKVPSHDKDFIKMFDNENITFFFLKQSFFFQTLIVIAECKYL